jgi:hypothetical protein
VVKNSQKLNRFFTITLPEVGEGGWIWLDLPGLAKTTLKRRVVKTLKRGEFENKWSLLTFIEKRLEQEALLALKISPLVGVNWRYLPLAPNPMGFSNFDFGIWIWTELPWFRASARQVGMRMRKVEGWVGQIII